MPFTSSVIWNLRDQTPAEVISTPLASSASYTWTAEGKIIPDQTAAPPAGNAGISMWQAGVLTPIQPAIAPSTPDQSTPPLAFVYSTQVTSRSPDGRYAVFGLPLSAQVPARAGDPAQTFNAATCDLWSSFRLCALARLDYPDLGLTAVAAKAEAGHTSRTPNSSTFLTIWPQVGIAWQPDHKVLAATLPGDGLDPDNQDSVRVTLFRTDTGLQVGQLTADRPFSQLSFQPDGRPPFSWAPSGQRLALSNYGTGTVTIWSGSALPA